MSVETGKKLKQYFIAVIPPSPVFDEALKLKHHFKERYNSKASLNSPPHITLHMPFRWKADKEEELIEKFKKFNPGVKPFKLQLSNFNSFPPRVIFIDVIVNVALKKLQKEITRFCKRSLDLFNADYKEQPFHPHITLAFRDLKKSMYAEAWREFQERKFCKEFIVDRYLLLKHNGKVWENFREFPLN
jgi:2'-5' RNA ligase